MSRIIRINNRSIYFKYAILILCHGEFIMHNNDKKSVLIIYFCLLN